MTGERESPLAGVAYDAERGEFDLLRFVPSSTDDEIRSFLAAYTPDMQAALTEADLYTLLNFARRTALAVMRGAEQARLDDARAAIRAVDSERVDPRDVEVASALVEDPDSSGYVRIETSEGPALVLSPLASQVSARLISIAFALESVLEQDTYRVLHIEGGGDVPAVWFSEDVEGERSGIRATVTVTAQLDPATDEEAESQQFTIFLAEAASGADAERLAAAAVPSDWFQALGVASGPVCCIAVARSWVQGVEPYEQAGSLERFREPFTGALQSADRPAAPGG